jgi:hypothetical protein
MAKKRSSQLDAKTIAAIAALVAAVSGGVEMRVQIGLLAQKVDRIEARLDHLDRTAHLEE